MVNYQALYENDEYIVIKEYSDSECEWEYYIGGHQCDEDLEYAVLDKNDIDKNGAMFHSGHLCEKHIHEVWGLLTSKHRV